MRMAACCSEPGSVASDESIARLQVVWRNQTTLATSVTTLGSVPRVCTTRHSCRQASESQCLQNAVIRTGYFILGMRRSCGYCEPMRQQKKQSRSARVQDTSRPTDVSEPKPTTESIKIIRIAVDDQTHPRAKLNQAVVAEYSEAMRNGDVFPPIDIFCKGTSIYLADGRHRIEAARRLARTTILAEVHSGDHRDAILFALAANTTHGVRRSNADKRKAVRIVLADPEWRTWSANEIAKRCNVSWGTVRSVWAEVRKEFGLPAFEDTLERKVRRGGSEFTQKKRRGRREKPKDPFVDAIAAMLNLSRTARAALAASSDNKLEGRLHRVAGEIQKLLGSATEATCRMTDALNMPLNVYVRPRSDGIKETPEFKKKGLCNYAVNVGMACGHQCAYCSSPALRFRSPLYGELSISAYDRGYAVIDPKTPERILKAIPDLTAEHVIQMCTMDDAWSPEARRFNVGRKCLEILLKETPAQVRILTKSAEVVKDFGVAKGFEARVMVGLSTGIPPSREDVAVAVEPNASPVRARLKALRKARDMGLRTYGMLCPCLPVVSSEEAALETLFDEVLGCGVEDIWLEPLNSRGKGLHHTVEALRTARLTTEADAVDAIRSGVGWSSFATHVIQNAIRVATQKGVLDKLHVLLYPDRLTPPDRETLEKCKRGIVWLGKDPEATTADEEPSRVHC